MVVMVFKEWFKKEKPRVFLGNILVVPRNSFKDIDEWGFFHQENLGEALNEVITDIFQLPLANNVDDPKKTDLVVDVAVVKYQSGDIVDIGLHEIPLFWFWRPKVEVRARLYKLTSGKTLAVFTSKEKMKWGEYWRKMMSLRAFFRFRPVFDKEDIQILLCKSCIKLVEKMKKAI
ncbi:hypothetical protein BTA51_27655 [Hahella sp. CCB-MM4]|uniref:hypothetical protein n=1 Tax=Hahella sp. (strain CCB-MM4) TaxID=1926491 RepID=UPI000B9C419F|nr:hypothetical protein [Hahella sp. CCB-MM4]OZG70148.1 hypothetical protein BTA51_27655 [Hahella sp. CCB-MM4]